MGNDSNMAGHKSWTAFWLHVLKNNPPWILNALAEFAPPVWAELKRDCGVE